MGCCQKSGKDPAANGKSANKNGLNTVLPENSKPGHSNGQPNSIGDPELGNLKPDYGSRPVSASKQMESMMNLSIPDENPGRSDPPISLSFHLQIGNQDGQPDVSMQIPDENEGGISVGRLVGLNPNSNEAVLRKNNEPQENSEFHRYMERPNSPPEIGPLTVEVERPNYPSLYLEKPKVQMQVQMAFTPTASAGLRENWLPLLPLRLDRIYSRVEEIFPYLHFLGPPTIDLSQDSGAQPLTWWLNRGDTANYGNSGALPVIYISLELPADKRAGIEMIDAMQTLETRLRSTSAKRLAVCSVFSNQDHRKARTATQGLLKVEGDKIVQIIESTD